MYCKDCKHWKCSSVELFRGDCSSDKFIDTSWQNDYSLDELTDYKRKDTLEYHDYESWKAGFSTGGEFGCVHFERR